MWHHPSSSQPVPSRGCPNPFVGQSAHSCLGRLGFLGSAGAQSLQDTVARLRADYVAAFNAGDAARLASFYAEDAVYMSPSAERVEGRSAIELHTRSAMSVGSACSLCPESNNWTLRAR